MIRIKTLRPIPRRVAIPPSDTDDPFGVVKAAHRLWIQDRRTGSLLYTHPDFIRLTNRTRMQELADAASAKGCLDISDIIAFEAGSPRAPGYSRNRRIGQK
jgi:hypothetical protein